MAITGYISLGVPIGPNSDNDPYFVTNPAFGLGGLRTVTGSGARDAIIQARRQEGMVVYVQDTQKFFTLIGGTGNTGWTEIISNGASASSVVSSFNGLTGAVVYAPRIATSSLTGVASFGNEFIVSSAGAVSLTGNYVRSFNGATGTVVYAPPIATSAVTGVASFTNDFVVSAAGAVSITSNNVYTVNGRTGNVGLPLATSSVTGVASFTNDFVVSAAGAVSITSNNVYSVNGRTGNVGLPVANSVGGITGVMAPDGTYLNGNAAGIVSITNSVATTILNQTLSGYNTFSAGLSTASLFVGGGGITLNSRATFVSGLTSLATIATHSLSVDQGLTVGTVSATTYRNLPQASASVTGVASFGNEFVVSADGAVSLTGNYVRSFNGSTGTVVYAPPVATTAVTGVASFNSSFFTVSSGAVSLAAGYQVTGDTVVAGTNVGISRSGNSVTVSSTHRVATASLTGVASFNPVFFTTGTTGHINPTDALLKSAQVNVGIPAGSDGNPTNSSNLILTRGLQSSKMSGIQTSTSGLTTTTQEVFTARPFYAAVGSTAAVTIFGPGLTSESVSFSTVNGIPQVISALTYAPIGAAEVSIHLRRINGSSVLVGTEFIKLSILSTCNGATNATQYTESRIASGSSVATVAVVPLGNDYILTVTPVSTDSTIIAASSTLYPGTISAV